MIACKIGNVAMIKEILKYNPDVLLKNEVQKVIADVVIVSYLNFLEW